jgi:hypothetical protein
MARTLGERRSVSSTWENQKKTVHHRGHGEHRGRENPRDKIKRNFTAEHAKDAVKKRERQRILICFQLSFVFLCALSALCGESLLFWFLLCVHCVLCGEKSSLSFVFLCALSALCGESVFSRRADAVPLANSLNRKRPCPLLPFLFGLGSSPSRACR